MLTPTNLADLYDGYPALHDAEAARPGRGCDRREVRGER
jgi:hypothetical protein